ncbi:MAG: hypothetical protein FD124_3976, partial [Alphaproteobacteria bacterium]
MGEKPLMRQGEIAGHGLTGLDIARDNRAHADLRPRAQTRAVYDDRGWADIDAVADLRPTKDIGERANLDPPAGLNVVSDIDQIVRDRLFTEERFAAEQRPRH